MRELLFGIFLGLAWVTRVISCIKVGTWGLLFIGALMFPIGIIHGVMIWFGAGWAH